MAPGQCYPGRLLRSRQGPGSGLGGPGTRGNPEQAAGSGSGEDGGRDAVEEGLQILAVQAGQELRPQGLAEGAEGIRRAEGGGRHHHL